MRGESSNAISLYKTLRAEVYEITRVNTPFNDATIDEALASLFDETTPNFLALPHQYFDTHEPEQIAKHVATLIASKELARSNNRPFDLQIQQEGPDSSFFAARSLISTDQKSGKIMRQELGLVSPAVSTLAQ